MEQYKKKVKTNRNNGSLTILPTRLRSYNSDMYENLYNRNLSITMECTHGEGIESTAHFLLNCKKYNESRRKLYEILETKTSITNVSEETLLNGSTTTNKENNIIIIEETVNFIINSKRFKLKTFT